MRRLWPCKRKDFIKKLKNLGFSNLEAGSRHGVMRYRSHKQIIPNNQEYSVPQMKKLLKQVGEKLDKEISVKEWNDS
ncbi:MAG: type II toxin-antitoxin system HicA family toxin [Candidatus Anammoxibacter sp.]